MVLAATGGFSLLVRRGPSGEVEVLIRRGDWDGLPAEIARDMTRIPLLVDEALG